jgi:hypothetical protein
MRSDAISQAKRGFGELEFELMAAEIPQGSLIPNQKLCR